MKLGRIKTIRNDEILHAKQRFFRKAGDKTKYVAMVSVHKKSFGSLSPKGKEFWLGYYTPQGQQRGLGFFKSKKEIPKGFKSAFSGLDIKKRKKRKKRRK